MVSRKVPYLASGFSLFIKDLAKFKQKHNTKPVSNPGSQRLHKKSSKHAKKKLKQKLNQVIDSSKQPPLVSVSPVTKKLLTRKTKKKSKNKNPPLRGDDGQQKVASSAFGGGGTVSSDSEPELINPSWEDCFDNVDDDRGGGDRQSLERDLDASESDHDQDCFPDITDSDDDDITNYPQSANSKSSGGKYLSDTRAQAKTKSDDNKHGKLNQSNKDRVRQTNNSAAQPDSALISSQANNDAVADATTKKKKKRKKKKKKSEISQIDEDQSVPPVSSSTQDQTDKPKKKRKKKTTKPIDGVLQSMNDDNADTVVSSPPVAMKQASLSPTCVDKERRLEMAYSRALESASTTLHISPIPADCTFESIKRLSPTAIACRFSYNSSKKKFRQYAFIDYPDALTCQASRKALNGRLFGNRPLTAQPFQLPFTDKTSESLCFNWTQLFITRLPTSTNQTDLSRLFPKASQLDLPRSPGGGCRGYANVKFLDELLAWEAFLSVTRHNKNPTINGQTIFVNYLYERRKQQQPAADKAAAVNQAMTTNTKDNSPKVDKKASNSSPGLALVEQSLRNSSTLPRQPTTTGQVDNKRPKVIVKEISDDDQDEELEVVNDKKQLINNSSTLINQLVKSSRRQTDLDESDTDDDEDSSDICYDESEEESDSVESQTEELFEVNDESESETDSVSGQPASKRPKVVVKEILDNDEEVELEAVNNSKKQLANNSSTLLNQLIKSRRHQTDLDESDNDEDSSDEEEESSDMFDEEAEESDAVESSDIDDDQKESESEAVSDQEEESFDIDEEEDASGDSEDGRIDQTLAAAIQAHRRSRKALKKAGGGKSASTSGSKRPPPNRRLPTQLPVPCKKKKKK